LGGDSTLQLYRNRHLDTPPADTDQVANQELLASDFPTHQLRNPSVGGEPCSIRPTS
jgi:hypothetical protein